MEHNWSSTSDKEKEFLNALKVLVEEYTTEIETAALRMPESSEKGQYMSTLQSKIDAVQKQIDEMERIMLYNNTGTRRVVKAKRKNKSVEMSDDV